MKHPYAELMAQYAQDAMETDKPWERWEFKESAFNSFPWLGFVSHPSWAEKFEYRRKPKPYEPTLLDQALELEIEAAKMRRDHFIANCQIIKAEHVFDYLKAISSERTPEMIEHLKSQGKL